MEIPCEDIVADQRRRDGPESGSRDTKGKEAPGDGDADDLRITPRVGALPSARETSDLSKASVNPCAEGPRGPSAPWGTARMAADLAKCPST